ncbi:reprolysin-like metallopeptidase [Hymenobacter rubripertinctus]|uniref:T9SS C-terminal target domain-containing protein n=1 Tax=Hymenobacter rubripertinctus TaxID=2029981 RepID=A0A418QRP3_9BACT|nr:zinc-dependent metalloprotease family protein [Hymenobacter rubripertinctus]RIY07748.1 T9SS C-terminal target domain-containing protein [Hymenobacter rubripertinctus]
MKTLATLIRRALRPLLAGTALAAGTVVPGYAQRVLWSEAAPLPAAARGVTQSLTYYRAVDFQLEAVRAALRSAPPAHATATRSLAPVISLPLPDGRSQRFRVEQVPVLAPALAARYPALRTYVAQGLDDPTATARLDLTPAGFHAQILAAGSVVYIDPAAPGSRTHLVFERRAMHLSPFACAVPAADTNLADALRRPVQRAAAANGATLRTYRLALACTGEYATFHGGTKASALAAIVTSINRVSGIYEHELAVRLVLVAQNEALIFLDKDTDPYTDDDPEALLSQNQKTVDQFIGSANYDIGHVFSTGGGGIAQLGAVCVTSVKAHGVTGLFQPVGDAFDVDYVAHEMGHQFGADHTFNSQTGACGGGNRAGSSAFEPGSGTTIMAYAGICGADNIQPNSDAYFHSRSLDQIVAHLNGAGNCAVRTATGNTPPVVNAGRNYAIPLGTPFVLTGTATDANNDALTYSWEQYNLGPAGSPAGPVADAPLFRTFAPTTSPARTFPRLADILANTQTKGELLPTYGRRLIFRLVARDNRAGGGGTDYDSMHVVVVPTAGPFVVTAPNTATTWVAGAPQQVSWRVANTTQAPISAANVDIQLSTDGGLTFPTTLLAATPNDGNESFTLPASVTATTQARIRVRASGGIFFDVSDQNFTIEVPTGPTFYLQGPAGAAGSLAFCPGSSGTVALTVGQLQGFSGPVTLTAPSLPAGVTVSFANPTVAAGSGTTATISAGPATAAGTYTLALIGTSGTVNRTLEVPLTIQPTATQTATVTAPTAGSVGLLRPRIGWSAVANAAGYEVQLATNAAFTAGLQTFTTGPVTSFTPLSELLPATTYYVRVRALSACGAAPYSAAVSFRTDVQTCRSFVAPNLPQPIPAGTVPILTSVIQVTDGNRVSNVRIRDLNISHEELSDLEISLTNPAGQRVVVYPRLCVGAGTLAVSFDDSAPNALACPVGAGATVRPAASFAALLGSPATGSWTLTVADNNPGNGGTFQGWTLELCTLDALPAAPVSFTALPPSVQATSAAIDMLWVDKADNETGFEVERSRGGSTAFTRIATLPANTTFFTDNVTGNGQYCYRVRAVNTVGASTYSTESCQTVAGITSVNAATLQQSVIVAPNPSTGLFQVTIDTAQRGSMNLRVIDAVGRQVYTRTFTKNTEQLQFPLDLSALSSGIYTLHLTTSAGPAIVRLVKE